MNVVYLTDAEYKALQAERRGRQGSPEDDATTKQKQHVEAEFATACARAGDSVCRRGVLRRC